MPFCFYNDFQEIYEIQKKVMRYMRSFLYKLDINYFIYLKKETLVRNLCVVQEKGRKEETTIGACTRT